MKRIVVIILAIILCSSCTQFYVFNAKNEYNQSISYTLAIKKDKYLLLRDEHHGIQVNKGNLLKEDKGLFLLEERYNYDSLSFPVDYAFRKNQTEKFILKIDHNVYYYTGFEKVLINDDVFIDTLFYPMVNAPKTDIYVLNEKPSKVQLESNDIPSLLFRDHKFRTKSKLYYIPDSCNYMYIKYSNDMIAFLGFKKVYFNKDKKELFIDSDTMCLEKSIFEPTFKLKKALRSILRE